MRMTRHSRSATSDKSSLSTRWVPAPKRFKYGLPHSGHTAGTGRVAPQWWHTSFAARSWYVSDVEHESHSGTNPQSRHSRNWANPRWFSSRTAFSPLSNTSKRAVCKSRENIERLPPPNSRAMSTTLISGSGFPLARPGISTRLHEGSTAQRCNASSEGVAEPSTSTAP